MSQANMLLRTNEEGKGKCLIGHDIGEARTWERHDARWVFVAERVVCKGPEINDSAVTHLPVEPVARARGVLWRWR